MVRQNVRRPRRLLNAMRHRLGKSRRDERLDYTPVALDIEPTARCNLRCSMCQLSTWDRNPKDMTLALLKTVLDQHPAVLKIKLQGIGEPLLNKEFFAMVAEGVARGIVVETTTNGTMLSEANCRRLLDSGLTNIYLSVDGATAKTFEAIRRGAKFPRVIEGIRRLTAMRGDRRIPGIHIWTVGQATNIPELPELVRLAQGIGVDSLHLQYDLSYWGQDAWKAALEADSLRLGSEPQTFIEDAHRVAQEVGLPFSVYKGNKYSQEQGRLCPWPWSSNFISSEGFVVPCAILGNPDILNFGNVQKEDARDIWNGAIYQDFRRSMKRGDIPAVCQACYLDRTGGTLPASRVDGFVALEDLK